MIVITGAAGFIGSCIVGTLNAKGITNLVLVDDFSREEKANNLEDKTFIALVNRSNFEQWLNDFGNEVTSIIHIGARTDKQNSIKKFSTN